MNPVYSKRNLILNGYFDISEFELSSSNYTLIQMTWLHFSQFHEMNKQRDKIGLAIIPFT